MNNDTQRYLELLEQRVALLGSLAQSLSAASSGLVSFELDTLEARISEQEGLCTAIRSLDPQIDKVQRHCQVQLAASSSGTNADRDTEAGRLRETLDRLNHVQSTVKQLNDAHQLLLRRSRRIVGALLNSYHSFASTYSNPAASSTSAGERR